MRLILHPAGSNTGFGSKLYLSSHKTLLVISQNSNGDTSRMHTFFPECFSAVVFAGLSSSVAKLSSSCTWKKAIASMASLIFPSFRSLARCRFLINKWLWNRRFCSNRSTFCAMVWQRCRRLWEIPLLMMVEDGACSTGK